MYVILLCSGRHDTLHYFVRGCTHTNWQRMAMHRYWYQVPLFKISHLVNACHWSTLYQHWLMYWLGFDQPISNSFCLGSNVIRCRLNKHVSFQSAGFVASLATTENLILIKIRFISNLIKFCISPFVPLITNYHIWEQGLVPFHGTSCWLAKMFLVK